ncbi:MAG: AmmeMemoRadiSam system protein B [Candidatus Omnitrophota bacterium]
MSGIKHKVFINRLVFYFVALWLCLPAGQAGGLVALCHPQDIKEPHVSGAFYPNDPSQLSSLVQEYLTKATSQGVKGDIFALISPHAGYGYSGMVAGFGYRLIQDKPYKTVIIIGPSHHFGFSGVSVYPEGAFRTPLGDIEIDKDFSAKLLNANKAIIFEPAAFSKEHSIEVQLPFLQKALSQFKIVPIAMGDVTLSECKDLALLIKNAIGSRKDILLIASSDMYHGYDYEEAERVDNLALSYLKNLDAEGLYYGLRENKLQLCGGFAVVTTLLMAGESGSNKLEVLSHTNSSQVTQNINKGVWTVGYASCAIYNEKGEGAMLNKEQRKKLLEIARKSIEIYLKTNKKLELSEPDPALTQKMGAFVTLHSRGNLRGCIGNMVGAGPLYLTVRDMAVEAAVDDPRFAPLELKELKDVEIEISVLSPLEKTDSPENIQMGVHGVLVKRGFQSGVFLPQVATETGWSKEEFLSNLCSHKAGLPADAWKDGSCEIYTFTAEVFSEKSY